MKSKLKFFVGFKYLNQGFDFKEQFWDLKIQSFDKVSSLWWKKKRIQNEIETIKLR